MNSILRGLLGLWLICSFCALADVADPNDGTDVGGGSTDIVEAPPLGPPTAPATNSPAVETRSDTLKQNLESTTTLDTPTQQRVSKILDIAKTVDTAAVGHRPGAGSPLRKRLDTLRQEAIALENQVQNNPDALVLAKAFREEVERTELLVRQIDAAISNSNVNLGVDVSKEAVSLLSRGLGRSYNSRRGPSAGGVFSDWQFSLSQSYAEFDDSEAGGDGDDQEYSIFASALAGENFEVGFGLSLAQWVLHTGVNEIERSSTTPEFYLNYVLDDTFSFGFFMSYSETDVEDEIITDPGGLIAPFNVADQFGRWSTGVSASAHKPFGDHDVGITTAIVSANKSSLRDTFKSTDIAFMTMFDLQTGWTDQVTTALFATYYTLIDRQAGEADGSFWFVGGDVSYAINDRWRVTAGYETTLGMDGFDEHRLNTSVELSF